MDQSRLYCQFHLIRWNLISNIFFCWWLYYKGTPQNQLDLWLPHNFPEYEVTLLQN